ncbi:MAG TPA: 3-oxoacyl-ACP reductase FabG [Planctomycetota bacterium]|nr:3-oxoacyl-ACP reductase FabG [Planctomycetota bacterium]
MVKFDFTNQTVLVTGGTRGIGRAITEAFLNAGARVIAVYGGNDGAASKMKEVLHSHAERLILKKCDVSIYEQVEALFKEFETLHPQGLQIVVNNSGIRKDAVLAMMKSEDWRAVLDVNLTGTFNVSKFAVLSMMRKRYGRIVNITSPCGKFGFEGQANYAASKAGQVALTRSLSKEVATRGITVNCVSPGFISTELIGDLPEKLREKYVEQVPLKKFGAPQDVANCVLFLASKEAAYITGSVLEVTGGL